MMVLNSESGNSYYTPICSESGDILRQQQGVSRLDQTIGNEYVEEQHLMLAQDLDATEKLKAFELSNYDLIEQFHLGYADNSFLRRYSRYRGEDLTPISASLGRLGLLDSTKQEVLEGCMIFPLYNGIYYIPVGVYGYWLEPKEGVESDLLRLWNQDAVGVFNLDAFNAFSDLIVCQNPVIACQLIERGHENVIAAMGNGDTVEQFRQLFKHMPTQSIRIISNGDRYGQYWADQITEAMRLLNIDCAFYFNA
ncbi:hypothetical protein [Kangiella sp. TOML190]|uniref:hypothetical protein n=1 Tax=Kangiella sp. TOML190 TaxID=2931351 RepID=UPI00203F7D0B|nr:hypothetical protein [Kangiella sp. TOML190]